jgi:hypothetical protein
LNDIYIYSNNKWKEIIPENSLCPPPISSASMSVLFKKQLLIYGGITKDNGIQNNFYQFDIVKKNWSLLKVMGNKTSEKFSQLPLCI